MIAQGGGSIVNVASTQALLAMNGVSTYVASQAVAHQRLPSNRTLNSTLVAAFFESQQLCSEVQL
jgi:NADP-dependent 3-hydroxy acid dehydrogenase YdfG